jgi:hypothetical protein
MKGWEGWITAVIIAVLFLLVVVFMLYSSGALREIFLAKLQEFQSIP